MSDVITCPSCGTHFEPSAVLRSRVEAEVRAQLMAQVETRVAAEVRREKEKAQLALSTQSAELQQARAAAEAWKARVGKADAKEAELLRRQHEFEEKEQRAELEREKRLAADREQIRRRAVEEAEERAAITLNNALKQKDEELRLAQSKAVAASQREAELLKKQREVEEREQGVALELEKRLAAEREAIRKKALAEAQERAALASAEALRLKNEELEAERKKTAERAAREAELLKKQRELDERLQVSELEHQKRLAEEAARIREDQGRIAAENRRLHEAEHQEQLVGMRRTIEELQRKLQQGSQQLQGEAQELALRDILSRTFPRDEFEDVAKGARGADLIQRVRDEHGNDCGLILWESKRTKSWSDEWLAKLRDDQQEVGAVCCVIATQALPADIPHFGERKGVWVSSWQHLPSLAALLRAGMVETAAARRSITGRTEKSQLLYDYMTSPQFKNRIGGAIEALCEMQDDLEREKRALQSAWKRRERQFERAMQNLHGFYGDVRGLAGREVPSLEQLELEPANELPAGEQDAA